MGNPISHELFLDRARIRFGDAYDYASINYRSYKSPIKIRCRNHPVKEISITPEKHLQTTGGCKYCLKAMRVTSLERELLREAIEHPVMDAPSNRCHRHQRRQAFDALIRPPWGRSHRLSSRQPEAPKALASSAKRSLAAAAASTFWP
ncbi:hypothetical protein [Cyanobium sp. ATX-6F1]|uniref:hypothetical protein n=1 Tax=Cyanobium sp. ATX-6F1 TaxID=3137388 RepID=UPI0039BDFAF4